VGVGKTEGYLSRIEGLEFIQTLTVDIDLLPFEIISIILL